MGGPCLLPWAQLLEESLEELSTRILLPATHVPPPVPGPEGDNEVIFLRNSHLEDSLIWLIELGRQAEGRLREEGKEAYLPRGIVGEIGGVRWCEPLQACPVVAWVYLGRSFGNGPA